MANDDGDAADSGDGPDGPPPPGADQVPTSASVPTLVETPPDATDASIAEPVMLPPTPPAPVELLPKREDQPLARGMEIFGVVLAGFFGNLVLRTGEVASLAGALVVLVIVASLLASGRVRRTEPVIFLALASLLAPWLMVRSDNATTTATVVAIVTLIGVATGLSIHGSAFDTRIRDLAHHVWSPVYEWLYGLGLINRFATAHSSDRKLRPFLRGLAIAAPVLIVFTTLLASADEVFAKLLLLDDLPNLVGHIVLSLIVAVALFAWVSRAAHATRPSENSMDLRFLGPLEITIVLGSLMALFAAFVVTQIVVAAGGAEHVLQTEGLTAADHARAGFFQLLWVAGLAVTLVGGLRALRIDAPERGRDRFGPLALGTLALTLVIAAISIQRLLLYVGSFGLTPLRFWALAGAGGLSALIVVYALSIAGWRTSRAWYPGVAIVVAALFVFGLNVVNPDATVATFNLEHQTDPIDVDTLSRLSDDAVSPIVENFGSITGDERFVLVERLCARPDRETTFGVFQYNAGRVSADNSLDAVCGARVQASGAEGFGD